MIRSRGVRQFSLVMAGIVIATAFPLSAQSYDEHLDVRVIQVPVVVWQGAEAVRGLTRENFEVFVNGARQPIEHFDVLEFDAATTAPSKPSESLEQRRLTLLLFDLLNSPRIQTLRALPAIEKLVNESSPNDYFAVALYAGTSGMRYLAPFSGDRAVVTRAIANLEQSRSGDPLALALTREERAVQSKLYDIPISTESVEGGFSEELIEGLEDFDVAIEAWSGVSIPTITQAAERDQEMLQHFATDSWADALGAIADSLASLEGIKQVVLFSSGAAIETLQRTDQWASLRTDTLPSVTADGMHGRFRRAGVTLDIIDIAGLRAPGGDASGGSESMSHRTPNVLFHAADGTGGRVIHSTGVANAVRIFSETRRVTYMLGFRPPVNERDDNDIVVRLKNQPRFTPLSYRRGYSNRPDTSRSSNPLLLADAMLNDLRLDDVTTTIYADGHGTVDVGMPSDELLSHAVGGFVTVDVYLYVFDEGGTVVGWKHRRMRLEEATARPALNGAELVRRERFALTPGRYTAKALVLVEQGDLLSFRRKDFEIHASENPPSLPEATHVE